MAALPKKAANKPGIPGLMPLCALSLNALCAQCQCHDESPEWTDLDASRSVVMGDFTLA